MREYAKKPERVSRTLDSSPKASRQAPVSEILQMYRNNNLESHYFQQRDAGYLSCDTTANIIQRSRKTAIIGALLGGVGGLALGALSATTLGILGGVVGGVGGLVYGARTRGLKGALLGAGVGAGVGAATGAVVVPKLLGAAGGLAGQKMLRGLVTLGGAAGGLYEGMDMETSKKKREVDEPRNCLLEVFYSVSSLGHFTLFMKDGETIYRVHYVLNEVDGQNKMMRKMEQLTGTAKGKILSDIIPKDMYDKKYEHGEGKEKINTWQITQSECLKIRDQVIAAGAVSSNYGYIIYCNDVDNCGSFLIKSLDAIGISVTLPRFKTWSLLPTLIKEEVSTPSKMKDQ